MANGHGGRRPGAGAVPRDLTAILEYRPVRYDDAGNVVERRGFSVMDLIVEAIRAGAFLHDAAPRAGVTVETLRDWLRQGNKARHDVAAGTKRRAHLSRRLLQYAELAARVEEAEANAKLAMLGTMQRVAQGGIATEVIVEKVDTSGTLLERNTRKSSTLPDANAAAWVLSHRWPQDFHGRQELTGPEGSPIQVDTRPALERLRDLATRNGNGHEPDPNHPETTPNGAATSPNGHQSPNP